MRSPSLTAVLLFCLLPIAAGAQADIPLASQSRAAGVIPQADTGRAATTFAGILAPNRLLFPGLMPVPAQDTGGLTVELISSLASRLERNTSNRCATDQGFLAASACRSNFQPLFDFEFNLLASGRVGSRILVNVDYDSRREFDASNDISVAYSGAAGEILRSVEIGSVSFHPTLSRYITSGIPTGNYGLHASALFGNLEVQAIAARQRGRVVQGEVFTIGDQAERRDSASIEDFRFDPRRFFFTVDPALLDGYPNIDILNREQMLARAAALPDTLRPVRIYLYRVLPGTPPPNPNGPQFSVRGARNPARGLVYEYLREGFDYYADPSLLWIALNQQLRRDERLVVSYNVLLADGTSIYPATGGTPDLTYSTSPQFANLLWDPEVLPGDPAFRQEIRSVYRVAGDGLVRESVMLKIVSGAGNGQERPPAGASTYLQQFGVALPTSPTAFDFENRLWPRPTDPNTNRGSGATGAQLVRGTYLVFPSLTPFASDGLAGVGNPSNDTLYSLPSDDIYSSRRPASVFRMLLNFATTGGDANGVLMLGTLQLRRGSERILVDGFELRRDRDYDIDYSVGQITFMRPDTLFAQPRRVEVRYEEDPLFAETPTSILALSSRLPVRNGEFSFTAISQSQRSAFSRPVLGFEPSASLVAGATANFGWDLNSLTRVIGAGADATASRLNLRAEVAVSRPSPNSSNVAYLESFQGASGQSASISESQWYFGSRPISSALLSDAATDLTRASTMAWQNYALDKNGQSNIFRSEEIDPNIALVGRFSTPEPLLWLSLYPLSIGGQPSGQSAFDWLIAGAPAGRRWRSIRTALSPTGSDLTSVENIEFWGLIDTAATRRSANPTLVIDLGDVSENSLVFSPDTLRLTGAGSFSGYRGKRQQGNNILDSERDPLSRSFDAAANDNGIAGDVADRLVIVDAGSGAVQGDSLLVRTCQADRRVLSLGDTRANCTVHNARLDEEDLDSDGVLNFPRESERVLRYVVDMSDASRYDRVGGCLAANDPRAPKSSGTLCWVHFKLPLGSPDERIGDPLLRRMKTMRLTMLSGAGAADADFTYLPLTRISLTGAPWQKRSGTALRGIAGDAESGGFVISTRIGTEDSTATLPYVPPPGVREQAEELASQFAPGQVQVNERALRLRAGDMQLYERAEAYYRFPDGQKNFMAYRQLRLWARGHNSGWGEDGELNFFVRLGRDANNFYLYRSPLNSGLTQNAWEPEVRVDFDRWFKLRAQLQQPTQGGEGAPSGCSAADSALVMMSATPPGGDLNRRVACDGPYMAYTVDPLSTPPSLAAVQEMSVGFVRMNTGGGSAPIIAGDTLEMWVDEIRLGGVVDDAGVAGLIEMELIGSDVGNVRLNLNKRDRSFRQLSESPLFLAEDAIDFSSTVRLDRLANRNLGWALPLTISHSTVLGDPLFVAQSDIPGEGIPGLRTPRSSRSNYSMSARRITPTGDSPFARILSGLTLLGSYSSDDSRSEFSSGGRGALSLGADLNLSSSTAASLPAAGFGEGAGAQAAPRRFWVPTLFRFSTTLTRDRDNRDYFLSPSVLHPAGGSLLRGQEELWSNTATVELRPLTQMTARVDLASTRDLRDYGDSSAFGLATASAGAQLLGADIGMERSRDVRTSLSYSPSPFSWLRTRLLLSTRFSLSRDISTFAASSDSVSPDGGQLLPRRFWNSQQLAGGLTFDFGRIYRGLTGDSVAASRVARVLAPLDFSFSRNLTSSFSAAGFMPGVFYQFALGNASSFREEGGQRASSAAQTNTVTLSHTVNPFPGASLLNRATLSFSDSWTSLLGDRVFVAESDLITFPDLSLRIDRTFSGRATTGGAVVAPAAVGTDAVRPGAGAIRSLSIRTGIRRSERETFVPPSSAVVSGSAADRSRDYVLTVPSSASINWGLFGGFQTGASLGVTAREDTRPGVQIRSSITDVGAEVSKTFPAGVIRGLRDDILARATYSQRSSSSDVFSSATGSSSRLLDNGQHALRFFLESSVSETMLLTIGGSQVVTWDRNFNRRFTQTQLSAVLQISFFAASFR